MIHYMFLSERKQRSSDCRSVFFYCLKLHIMEEKEEKGKAEVK